MYSYLLYIYCSLLIAHCTFVHCTFVQPPHLYFRSKVNEIIVFILNGTTYEEARFINYLNEIHQNYKIVLCSNFIHNNRR